MYPVRNNPYLLLGYRVLLMQYALGEIGHDHNCTYIFCYGLYCIIEDSREKPFPASVQGMDLDPFVSQIPCGFKDVSQGSLDAVIDVPDQALLKHYGKQDACAVDQSPGPESGGVFIDLDL